MLSLPSPVVPSFLSPSFLSSSSPSSFHAAPSSPGHPALRPSRRHGLAAAALAAVVGAAAALAPAGARAEAGPYLVLSAGISQIKVACGGATPCDTKDNGFKILLGTRGPANVALEGGYWNFGQARVGTGSAKVDGFGVTVALHDDFQPEWTAAGRLGFASLKGSGAALGGSNTTPIYGFSLGYRLTPKITLEGAIDAARPKFEGARTNVQLLGAHVSISF
jgi:opacity protein-like surface antigen